LLALRRQGLERLVLCPGSRSAPLAVAAGLLEPGGLQLFTAVDERSAAFFALGLGRAAGVPAAVVTTSGSAVANLLPAVVEADRGAIPLLLLSADRPARLKNRGANQTVNQEEFLAPCCRLLLQASPNGLAQDDGASLESLARRAWQACLGSPAGPVHLNLPFEEPLHIGAEALARLAAESAGAWADGLVQQPAQHPVEIGVPGLASWAAGPGLAGGVAPLAQPALTTPARGNQDPMVMKGGTDAWEASAGGHAAAGIPLLDPDRAGLVVAGPWRGTAGQLERFAAGLIRWQRRSGWPVLADGPSGLRGWPELVTISAYDLLLADAAPDLAPGQLLRLGPLPASRRLQQWLAAASGPQLLISEGDPRNWDGAVGDPLRWSQGLVAWLDGLPEELWQGLPAAGALAQGAHWLAAEAGAQAWLDRQLPAMGPPNEPALARALGSLLPPGVPLMLASSSPVRDWESFSDPGGPQRRVYGFRGASGIDGTLSMACGLAELEGRLVLLTGDLALLHDSHGWLWKPQLGGQLTVVLVENGGGGIFEQLPIRPGPAPLSGAATALSAAGTAAPQPGRLDFERLFAMPQAVSHGPLAEAFGVPWRRLGGLEDLADGLAWAAGEPLALLELRTDRQADAALRQALRQGWRSGGA
jgi:2-succinyl-5-enolpyruvyl-6-hydroxy-3-cyclohexene-1-carboxylate synthase